MNCNVNIIKSNRGFTLIELMVALAMSLFLVGGVILMYMSVQATSIDSRQLSRMQENVRFASDYMVRDIRNAGFRDEMSLTIGEEESIINAIATLSDSGNQLTVRYAGRGHCQDEFQEYRVVENTYFFDATRGELRCWGRSVPPSADDPLESMGLVQGLTGVSFRLIMANGDETATNTVCRDDPLQLLADRCLAVRVGLELEGLRDLDTAGAMETRYVELFATFRNSAIGHVYSNFNQN